MAKTSKPKKAKASKAVDAPSFSRSINVDMDKAKAYAEKLLRTK